MLLALQRQAYGSYPATLAGIGVPDPLNDPATGAPMEYERTEDGYRLSAQDLPYHEWYANREHPPLLN